MVVKSSVLKELEECYREPGNQLVVLYGRTDSEKERLLSAFVQNKKHFYYRARQVAEREQRAQMGRELTARFEVMLQKYTYEEYFNRVKSGDPTKLVVVIDEFQYIAKKDPTFGGGAETESAQALSGTCDDSALQLGGVMGRAGTGGVYR